MRNRRHSQLAAASDTSRPTLEPYKKVFSSFCRGFYIQPSAIERVNNNPS